MDLPQHVLRFWETRFPQIRPLKRAGGRRYYRPDDVERLRVIKRLLYDEGYTIKGVQKLFRQQGVQALTDGTFEPRLALGVAEAMAQAADEGLPVGSRPRPESFEPPVLPAAPPVEARPAVPSPADLAALRGALAEIAEAQRVLEQARSSEIS